VFFLNFPLYRTSREPIAGCRSSSALTHDDWNGSEEPSQKAFTITGLISVTWIVFFSLSYVPNTFAK
jgi:hypothetical protein